MHQAQQEIECGLSRFQQNHWNENTEVVNLHAWSTPLISWHLRHTFKAAKEVGSLSQRNVSSA
jgi:hypothetical protein